jgi:hypothetical protein
MISKAACFSEAAVLGSHGAALDLALRHHGQEISMRASLFAVVPLMLALGAAQADTVSDALQAAVDAYAAGDLAQASVQISTARHELDSQQSALLTALMPPAPDGMTATPTEGFGAGIAAIGGGAGAEMRYENADQSVSFTVTYYADNSLVSSMAQMLGNAEMMALMGKVVKVGDQTLLETDGNLTTLVADRVLVQAQGASVEAMLPVVQVIDFAKLGKFDSK